MPGTPLERSHHLLPPQHPRTSANLERNPTLDAHTSALTTSEQSVDKLGRRVLFQELRARSQNRDLHKIIVERRCLSASSLSSPHTPLLSLPSFRDTQNPVAKLRPLLFFKTESIQKTLSFLNLKTRQTHAKKLGEKVQKNLSYLKRMHFLQEQVIETSQYFPRYFPEIAAQSPTSIREEDLSACIRKIKADLEENIDGTLDLESEFENVEKIQAILSKKQDHYYKEQKDFEKSGQGTVIFISDDSDEEDLQMELFNKLGNNFLQAYLLKQLQDALSSDPLAQKEEALSNAQKDCEPFYRKDDLLSLCSLLESVHHFPEEEKDRFSSFTSVADSHLLPPKIRMMKGEYLSKRDLKTEISNETLDLLTNLTGFSSSVPQFTCLDEVLTHIEDAGLHQEMIQNLDSLIKTEGGLHTVQSSFALKVGVENPRELIAKTVAEVLGLERFLVGKFPSPFPDVSIGALAAGDSIAGRWIEGESFDFDDWNNSISAKQEFEEAKFNFENAEPQEKESKKWPLESARVRYELCKENLTHSGGKESIQTHALLDLPLGSYDSHIGQYSLMSSEMWGFDLSRILLPGELQQVGDDEYTFPFRSAFFDHPFSEDPLDLKLVEKIQEWDGDKIEEYLKQDTPLLGTQEEFNKMETSLTKLIKEYDPENTVAPVTNLATEPDTLLKKICARHNIPYDEEVKGDKKNSFSLLKKSLRSLQENKIHSILLEKVKSTLKLSVR
ncbi:MAG: hypothetical protein ACI9YB_002233 [Halioglobus sp.]|jgi:hypothetical protein